MYRLCHYECDWRGTVNERPTQAYGPDDPWYDSAEYQAAAREQDEHMEKAHGYPYAPMRYRTIRRVVA